MLKIKLKDNSIIEVEKGTPIIEVAKKNKELLKKNRKEMKAAFWADEQDFSQEDCSVYMNIARTTAQQIYNSARKKLALVLVEGRPLRIEGGHYRLCDGSEPYCGCGGCRRHRMERAEEEEKP